MSVTLLREMQRHETPESFITKFLIPAIDNRNFPPLDKRHELVLIGKPVPVQKILLANGDERIPIEVTRTVGDRAKARGVSGRHSAPHMRVGLFSKVYLAGDDDYAEAERHLGTVVRVHPHSGTESHVLNLPATIASHWRGKAKVISARGASAVLIPLDNATFSKLKKALEIDKFTRRLLDVLNHFEDNSPLDYLRAHLRMGRDESHAVHPVSAFLETHRDDFETMRQIGIVRSESGIKAILSRRFGASERPAFYAKVLGGLLSHPNGQRAMRRLLEFEATHRVRA